MLTFASSAIGLLAMNHGYLIPYPYNEMPNLGPPNSKFLAKANFNSFFSRQQSNKITSPGQLLPIATATMTTVRPDYPATNLFDGNYGTFAQNEDRQPAPYGFNITLELGFNSTISRIVITNRLDCCLEKLLGFSVYIGREEGGKLKCGTIRKVKREYVFRCTGIGRRVSIRSEDRDIRIVSIAEVEIFGQPGNSK